MSLGVLCSTMRKCCGALHATKGIRTYLTGVLQLHVFQHHSSILTQTTRYGEDDERIMVPSNSGSIVHNMVNTEQFGGGLAIKIRDLPHYRVAPAGIVQVEYNLEPSKNHLWYDLSAIDCDSSVGPENPRFCPLVDGGIKLYAPNQTDAAECPEASCVDGVCYDAYTAHGSWHNEPTFRCRAGADLLVETCFKSAGRKTVDTIAPDSDNLPSSQPISTPPPQPTSLPPPEPENTEPYGPLIISPNGSCGDSTEYTCKGSRWGDCCSQYGFCGKSELYCDAKCQSPFGVCPGNSSTPAEPEPQKVSTNGTCGAEAG
jgi:hypothetical protein